MTTSSSSSSSSSLSPRSLFVRKFTDSNVIGSHQQLFSSSSSSPLRPRTPQDEPRVISCNFEMQVPTNALRIDMTILVSTNTNSHECEDNPSVSYKITICTPRHHHEEDNCNNDGDTTTTSTLRWSSKFTVAKGNENCDPFHEWSGSFLFGDKKTIEISDCSFHQLQGTFNAHNINSSECTKPLSPQSQQEQSQQDISTRKTKINNANDDACIFPTRKRRRKNSIHQEDCHRRQQQQDGARLGVKC